MLAIFLVYYAVGLVYERHQYAIQAYYRSKLTTCAPRCNSHDWSIMEYRKQYCTCGYLCGGKHTSELMALALFWPIHFGVNNAGSFLTSGTYEPKEVKAARIQKETKELEAKMEARTRRLEVAAGLRLEEDA